MYRGPCRLPAVILFISMATPTCTVSSRGASNSFGFVNTIKARPSMHSLLPSELNLLELSPPSVFDVPPPSVLCPPPPY